MPLARWGEPGRGVKPSQVTAGAPFGAAVETTKRAAQLKRTDSIVTNFHKNPGTCLAQTAFSIKVMVQLLLSVAGHFFILGHV